MQTLPVVTPIKLTQFLKLANLAETGGHATELVLEGLVEVDGQVVRARGKKLTAGQVVTCGGQSVQVVDK